MSWRVWRLAAVTIAVVLLAFVVADCTAALVANADAGFVAQPDGRHPGDYVVQSVTNPKAIDGPLHAGDRVRLADGSLTNRLRFVRQRAGDRFAFTGTTSGGARTAFVATSSPAGPVAPTFWIYQLFRLVLVLVALLVAIRRPNDGVARILVGLFLALAALAETGTPWFPLWLTGALIVVRGFAQVFSGFAALAIAVTFPARSEHGVRRRLERANLPFFAICLTSLYSALALVILLRVPSPPWLQALGIGETVLYFVLITIAFVVGGRDAVGADRKRAQWVSWTLAVGFSGTLIQIVLIVSKVPIGPIYDWFGLTLLAIPFGLGYAIVRHRVVDVGFVVNRALVFGTVSAIVLVCFTILEWVLSNVFVRVSHITSTSLELALALVLGFFLRSIHARVDRVVDDVFFRDRHEAERALIRFAKDVAFIVDARIAIARAHAELVVRTGAASAAVYVVDGHAAVRVDPAETPAPDRIGVDDPALVRMRATRTFCGLRRVEGTSFAGDHAFPMCVRDAVTGCVVLAAKSNGEAYAPDELATIETVALAVGNALDALQTAALKADVARVLFDGAPVDALRSTVDPAAWVRGVTPQPAGSLLGLGE